MNISNKKVLTGLDVLEDMEFRQIKGSSIGLLVNQASVNSCLKHAADILHQAEGVELKKLFGPQHGIYGNTQDNMIEWEGFTDPQLGIPVYSLYGTHRKPISQMLEGIDTMIVDLPDVGSRYYTFVWTAKLCMEACAEHDIRMIVLDRPNPIGGKFIEGPYLDENYRSFVGLFRLPIRHGMTIGELLMMINKQEKIECQLEVIKMRGWKRDMWFEDTGLAWVMPSPNMPAVDTAIVYPGFCLLEGTNLSEGRGTCRPFEICGAPFIDAHKLVNRMNDFKIPGVFFRPTYFEPTFNIHAGNLCGGFQMHVTDRAQFRSVKAALAMLFAVKDLYPGFFAWKKPPYEYEYEKMPIDILWGDSTLRDALDSGASMEEFIGLQEKMFEDAADFKLRQKEHLFYS